MSRDRGKKTNLDSDDVGHLVTRMARKKKCLTLACGQL